MVEVHHVELGLVEGSVGSHFRVVDILYLHEGSLPALTSVGQHFRHSEDPLAEGALADRV